ncbi:serine/threonine-protein phosphatase [Aquifex pyrophilus]
MRVKSLCITNTGRVRPNNEDALLVDGKVFGETAFDTLRYEEFELKNVLPFAVADGLGGHSCGEKASRLTLEVLKECIPEKPEDIKDIILRAKKRLDEFIEEHEFCYGMGTALAGLYLFPNRAFVFNVGDCRVYRFREGELELLTEDHTYVFRLYKEGRITYDELRHHPERNLLETAVMGGYPDIPEVFVRETDIREGDNFLICSDGLWEVLSFNEKVSCMKKEDIKEKGECLYSLALENSKDNVSLILLEVD